MCRATASTSAGSQSKSGNPCDRLIAPRSVASFDMTVKMVVPTLGSFEVKRVEVRGSGLMVQTAYGLRLTAYGSWLRVAQGLRAETSASCATRVRAGPIV